MACSQRKQRKILFMLSLWERKWPLSIYLICLTAALWPGMGAALEKQQYRLSLAFFKISGRNYGGGHQMNSGCHLGVQVVTSQGVTWGSLLHLKCTFGFDIPKPALLQESHSPGRLWGGGGVQHWRKHQVIKGGLNYLNNSPGLRGQMFKAALVHPIQVHIMQLEFICWPWINWWQRSFLK